MKPTLFFLPALLLAACSQVTEPAPQLVPGVPPANPPAPTKPREPEEWEKYGMASNDAYWEFLDAVAEDDLPRAKAVYKGSKMPLEHFADKSFTNCAGKCFSWALSQGYKPEVNTEFWNTMLTDWCCDVDEGEADKLRHVLIPLLKAQPKLMQESHFVQVMIYAAEFGCRQTMQQLLALGAPADVVDAEGLSPLDFALFYEYADIAAMLRAHGAKRHTPRPTVSEVWNREMREAEELRKKVAEEYQAQLKTLKPGEMPPIMAVVPGPIHRPSLRSEAAKERQRAELPTKGEAALN